MKCIVKKFCVLLLAAVVAGGQAGCGSTATPLEREYEVFTTTEKYGIGTVDGEPLGNAFFGEELCVGGNEDVAAEGVTERLSLAAGLFDVQGKTILYAKNIHERLYPASTTKVLTAYVALRHGDLGATATVSAEALKLDEGSATCGLSAGDTLTLEQLLYGLLLCSGNDAANVIAELVSGSVEQFAELMNREALALGATNTHFVNPHGLHDEEHYTTVYDLYLIFRAALEDDTFQGIINTTRYKATFLNKNGKAVEKEWSATNRYLTGEQTAPEGVTVIGGKTGTTYDAGSCLLLYSKNSAGSPFISIVMKADGRENLYSQMNELLTIISN